MNTLDKIMAGFDKDILSKFSEYYYRAKVAATVAFGATVLNASVLAYGGEKNQTQIKQGRKHEQTLDINIWPFKYHRHVQENSDISTKTRKGKPNDSTNTTGRHFEARTSILGYTLTNVSNGDTTYFERTTTGCDTSKHVPKPKPKSESKDSTKVSKQPTTSPATKDTMTQQPTKTDTIRVIERSNIYNDQRVFNDNRSYDNRTFHITQNADTNAHTSFGLSVGGTHYNNLIGVEAGIIVQTGDLEFALRADLPQSASKEYSTSTQSMFGATTRKFQEDSKTHGFRASFGYKNGFGILMSVGRLNNERITKEKMRVATIKDSQGNVRDRLENTGSDLVVNEQITIYGLEALIPLGKNWDAYVSGNLTQDKKWFLASGISYSFK